MKYSVILPVFNGGEYLKLCVKSILRQTFGAFNLLVLDSGSTDGSTEWIESLSDSRIKIYPAQKKLTIEENWARIKEIPRNEFMTIIGHDDLLHPDYLLKMEKLISRFPDAGLYQSHFSFIDDKGASTRTCKPMKERISSHELLQLFLNSEIDTMGTGFMMRSRDFDVAGGMPVYPKLIFADMELWQKLAANGGLAVEEANLFSYRRHAAAVTASTDISLIIAALSQFADFLNQLKVTDSKYRDVIRQNCNNLLRQYCQGLSHKLLRTPVSYRNNLTVTQIIDQFRTIGKKLQGQTPFEPLGYFKIRAGKIIDSNSFLRDIYISLRRLFK